MHISTRRFPVIPVLCAESAAFFPAVLSPRRQIVLIGCVSLLCYVPFINKAFLMDADMLVHTSRQFLVDPINPPLGEYGRHMALHDHTKMPESSVFYRTGHPPLLPIVLAPVLACAGDCEWPLHAALFPFYLASIFSLWGMLGLFFESRYRLFGTLIFATCPSLLVNSSNIMWDVPITAFMLLSFFLFLVALRNNSAKFMFFSGLAAGAAALTKVNVLPLFLVCPAYLLLSRRVRFLCLWLAPAMVPPLFWVAHNMVVFGKIQYVSVGWYSFLLGDIRYRMERTIAYFGCALILPLFWVWLMVVRRLVKGLLINLLLGFAWGILLVVVLKRPVWYGISYALFSASGLWLLTRLALFSRGPKAGTYRSWEPPLIAAFSVLYIIVLNIMPSASMRYILPLVPFALLVLGEEISRISVKRQNILLTATLFTGALFSLLLAIGDYLQCDADRMLPQALVRNGFLPQHTWYYGRMSYDYYLFRGHFRNLRADGGMPAAGDFVVDEKIPGDYAAAGIIGKGFSLEPVDTIGMYRWPFRTMGCGAGFYGDSRLPFAICPGVPQKQFCVYRLHAD